jgi:hypothetical protein
LSSKLEAKLRALPVYRQWGETNFTESLILAQDERWRRA